VQQVGSPAVGQLFAVGGLLGQAGVYALMLSSIVTGALLIRRNGVRAVPGTVVLTAACFPFRTDHIFHPRGVLAMFGVAACCALLAASDRAVAPVDRVDPVAHSVARS
jgi:hypothetical protein